MSDLLRTYTRPDEIGRDGYPLAWHRCPSCLGEGCPTCDGEGSAKDLVRARAGQRCVRCGHPYHKGEHGNGEWSPCDERCTHRDARESWRWGGLGTDEPEARWRILTVHHLTGDKADLRWWNLAALCQRCHLTVQGRVQMARVYPWEHSEWFKPYAAGWYAWAYLGEELDRAEVEARLDGLLALEAVA